MLAVFALLMLAVTLIPKPVTTIDQGRDRTSLRALIRGH